MKIIVESPTRFAHKSFIETLEKYDSIKYKYVSIDPTNVIGLVFDVETELPFDEIAALTKKLIKDSPLGKTATVRIIQG